jgi:hypothetical protein
MKILAIRITKKLILIYLITLLTQSLDAQTYPKEDFTLPIKGRFTLSGDFGEIRSNHFHMGADLRLRTGRKIYAVADGYISRIKTEAGGYGKALYIDHPNGFRSVYAHLDRFTPRVETFIASKQIKSKYFTTLVYLDSTKFPVKKGELIAYGGNSGYSFGPHLHFEIRRSKNDNALNPYHFLKLDYDNRSPQIFNMLIMPTDSTGSILGENETAFFSLAGNNNRYYPTQKITASGKVGIAIQTIDRKPGQRNRYSVYRAVVYSEGKKIFDFRKDEISYYQTRYLNSFIDYELYANRKLRYTNLFREKGNKLSIYQDLKDDGFISLKAGEKKRIKIQVFDFSGNLSEINFTLQGEDYQPKTKAACQNKFIAGEKNFFVRPDFRLISDKHSFYDDFCFSYQKKPSYGKLLSDWHLVHKSDFPVHDEVYISIKAEQTDPKIQDKLCIVRQDSRGNLKYTGGKYIKGFISSEIRRFGAYGLTADTLAPDIYAHNFRPGNSVNGRNELQFKAKDDLSGIHSYEAYVNGEKTLLFYDLKTDIITYRIEDYLPQDKNIHLKIILFDKKANKTVYNTNFFK